MADTATNIVRSVLGQGLAMGWGDEAEAWLRSKLGDEEYESALREIRSEYGTFAKESPYISGIGEFAGGAAPAVAAMFVPGGQTAALGPLSRLYGLTKPLTQRLMRQNVARLGTVGGLQGAIAGAGAAEGDRTSGALTGGGFGLVTGVGIPLAGTALRTAGSRVVDLAGVSPDKAKQWALEKLNLALDEESPATIAGRVRQDIQLGVPPAVANVTPGTIQLAESVIQRGGKPARELEEVIARQQAGSRERVAKQVRRGLRAGDFYKQESDLVDELRTNAKTMYDNAYAVGDIDDPAINMVLQEPEFKEFFEQGQRIYRKHRLAETLDPQGDPSKYTLKQIYDPQTGQPVNIPDVRTLDYIKQGIDEKLAGLYKDNKVAEANALKAVREKFLNRLDALVPEYKVARAEYKGDIETLEALRMGRDEFNKMDPEQVQAFLATASKGEKDAFRTGVARNLFDQIMDPNTNIDAARKLIGSPSTRKAIEATIDTPAQRDFFMAALERETELFKAASKMLAGSPTEKRRAMREQLEARPGVAEAAAETLSRGFTGSIVNGVLSILRKGMPDEYYQELSDLLKTGRPKEVAAVVKLLEEAAKKKAPRAAAIGATEAGLVGGTLGLAPPAPLSEEELELYESLEAPYP